MERESTAEEKLGDALVTTDRIIGPWQILTRVRDAWSQGGKLNLPDLLEATKIFEEFRYQRGLFQAASVLTSILVNRLKFERARVLLAEIRKSLGEDVQKCVIDLLDASVLLHLSNHSDGEELVRSVLRTLVAEGCLPDQQAAAHGLLAQVAIGRGDVEAASSHLKEASRLTPVRRPALDLQSALLHLRSGRMSRAERILNELRATEGLPLWQRIEGMLMMCESLIRRHHWARVERLLEEISQSKMDLSGSAFEIQMLRVRGEIALGGKDFRKARQYFHRAERIADSADAVDVRTRGLLQLCMARTQLLAGNNHQAAALATEAYGKLSRANDIAMKAECELVLGRIYRAFGSSWQAGRYFSRALNGFGKLGDKLGEAECYDQLGNLKLLERYPVKGETEPEITVIDTLRTLDEYSPESQGFEGLEVGENLQEQDFELGVPTPRVRDHETVRSLFESSLRYYKEAERFSEAARIADSLASIASTEEIRRHYIAEARRLWRLAGLDELAAMSGDK
ncbi:tetratricopeptide repeat protein [Nannocystis pusilla]|uniref:tetratricopeptide repeat protein n=1 Tax=Nannocystis pusilla TaxID=889268 RepID=UPI003DA5002B